jgi:DNA mismatch endonuclease, patch repair protein
MDSITIEKRSWNMSRIRSKDTKPEMIIRRGLYRKGLRYRLHVPGMPGKPDLVFPKYKAIVLVNGCFWHGHDCHLFKWPSSRVEFWRDKITENRKRDVKNRHKLLEQGYRILVIWECTLKGKYSYSEEEIINLAYNWLFSREIETELVEKSDGAS